MTFTLGILGATGYIATPYRREIRECGSEAAIVALCARRRDQLAAASREDGAELATEDWRQVVGYSKVNTLLVATPDALHYEPVLAAARLGKHVICEKPLGINASQAHEMWEACRDTQVGHFVPFWTRYVPVFRRAREIVRQGVLGDVRAIVFRWHNPRPLSMPFTWRDDANLSAAGSVADVGSHVYDTIRWLLGTDANRVLAHAAVITPEKPDLGAVNLEEALRWAQDNPRTAAPAAKSNSMRRGTAYDYATIALEFPSGAVGTIILSHAPYLRKGLAPDVELHGAEASLALDRMAGTITLVRSGETPRVIETLPDPGFGNRFAKYVFPALRTRAVGEPCEHPGLDDGWRVQLFTDAAVLSAHRGNWVELAEGQD